MRLALDALEFLNGEVIHEGAVQVNLNDEIAALKAAITQAMSERVGKPLSYEETEPTAWQCVKSGMLARNIACFNDKTGWVPLYPWRCAECAAKVK